MKRLALICALFVLPLSAICAQTFSLDSLDSDTELPDFDIGDYQMNNRGDQMIRVALEGAAGVLPRNLGWGGAVSLGYNKFLSTGFSWGGSADFTYMRTRGSNIYYLVPVMAKGTFHLSFGRFEVPLSLSAGFSLQSYLGKFYFGPVVKPEAGVYYRHSSDWSIGITVGTTIIPQVYIGRNSAQSRIGSTLNAGLSVRYHF